MLDRYDRRIAAGVLARAALALQVGENLDGKSIVTNEPELRAALIAEARSKLGIRPDDKSPEVIEQIGAYFDEESERLIGDIHAAAAFQRLAVRGDLPSDLYNVQIIPNIANFFGKDFEREKALIERTVRAPTKEQHFGPPVVENEPHLISLFAREFKTPFPFYDFTMLVAGGRGKDRTLHVHQAWRLYQSKVDLSGTPTLVELLRRFADVYGADILLDGKRGRFFLTAQDIPPPTMSINLRGKKTTITVTQFFQLNLVTHRTHAALVVAIDLNLYRATLEKMDRQDIS